jgi:hypothetical protein
VSAPVEKKLSTMMWSGAGAPSRAAKPLVARRTCLFSVEPSTFDGKTNLLVLLVSSCPARKFSLVEPQQVAISMNWMVPSALLKTSLTRHRWTPARAGTPEQKRTNRPRTAFEPRSRGLMAPSSGRRDRRVDRLCRPGTEPTPHGVVSFLAI